METVRRANFRLRQLRRTSSRRMRAQAAIGGDPSVNHAGCGHARARGAGRFQRALTPTDRHRPAGRRCGCWPTSTVLFSGICCSQIRRRTLALGIGADADVGFAWSGRRWCRRRSSAASYRVIDNRSENLQHCQLTLIFSLLTRARRQRRRRCRVPRWRISFFVFLLRAGQEG